MKISRPSLRFISVFLMALGFLGCSSSMQATSDPSQKEVSAHDPGQNPGGNQGQDFPDYSNQDIPSSVKLSGYISSGTYADEQAVEIDRINKQLLFRVPMGLNPYVLVQQGSVPKYPDITFESQVLSSGRTFVLFRIPLKYVLRGIKTLDPGRLPNGNPLPGIPSGELPGLAVTMDRNSKTAFTLYLGTDFLAVFVESPFDPAIGLTFPVKDSTKSKVVGSFSMIPEDKVGHKQGGFFLAFQLPPNISEVLDKYVFP